MEFQNIDELKKLRVVELKERLGKLGKSTSGLKADLINRLYNALAEKSGQVDLSAAAPSYVQMCNVSSMEPEPPVVEVTIDTSQFDMSVQEPQIVTMGQYNVIDDVSQMNVQHQINEQQVYYQSADEAEQLRQQQEELWQQQHEEQLLRQQQQQHEEQLIRQQQEFERQEMERQELERIRAAAEEEAAVAAERMRVMAEEEERERQRFLEEEFRIQQQREEEEQMRRRYEEEQQQREFERQRELEMEMERQRQAAELERQLQVEVERQRELELERQRELEIQQQRELELERLREAELERQREAELQRQREAELQRQREAELQRQREAELQKQREIELERQREAELERQREAERERQREAELERQREAELERQREAELERQRQAELKEKQLMEMEMERQREIELLKQKEAERQRELELQRQREAEIELERAKELKRQELERQRLEEETLRELERQKELERQELARQQEFEKQKELERQRIAAEEEERRRKEHEAELQRKKEEEQMHLIYQEQLRKESEEQVKRQEEFQKMQEFQKKEKELEEEELRQSLIDEARKNEELEEKMDQGDDIQGIPKQEQEKELIVHHSTSVITHTGNAQNNSQKIANQPSDLKEMNNSINKENLDSAEEIQNGEEEKPESPKEKLSKTQKRKLKKKKRQQNRKEQTEKRNNMLIAEEEQSENKNSSDVSVEIQYVGDELNLNPTDPMYYHFMKIFENFKLVDPEQAKREAEEAALKAKLDAKKEPDLRKKPKDADEEPELEEKKDEQPKLSKRKMKQLTRLSIAELKQHVNRPDVVEMHDVTAKDPKLLVLLKSTRNTVPVPRHWCFKRKFLQGKRGIEKPPFHLPDFIKKTGIMEMRQALQEKEDQKTLKAKMREKVRPKMGKIDIDYQKLHDAFFKWQTKPRMTIHGDLYYEGKEYETRLKEKKPGELSDDLRTALGMPVGPGCQKIPPPWLIAMQRYGPPPSYPNLKVPGLNSPIPDGCSFGYHAGGWGKPPVDELGRPLYGDVFGTTGSDYQASMPEEEVDRTQWGELESESESESEAEEEEEEGAGEGEEEAEAEGIATPAEGGLATPSGLSSVSMGMETPDMIELRKRKIENEMETAENPTLYQVLAEKKPDRMSGLMMGSTHVYDVTAAMPRVRTSVSHLGGDGGVDVALDPSELDMDQATMASRYEQTLREQRSQLEKEDLSDMVAEHTAKQKNKRKRPAPTGGSQPQEANRSAKKYKDFKF